MKRIIKLFAFLLAFLMLTISTQIVSFAVNTDRGINFITDKSDSNSEHNGFIFDINEEFEDNVIMVTFKKEYSDAKKNVTKDMFPELNVKSISNYIISDPGENFTRDISITIDEHSKEKVISICEELSKRDDVLRVSPSYVYECETCQVPSDPKYSSHSTPYTKINAPSAWNITTGSSDVKVAVIDSKVDNHQDFGSNLTVGFDAENQNTVTNDCICDHGTSVASIIGAKANNDMNSVGVCWNVSIVPIQIHDSYYHNDTGYHFTIGTNALARTFSHMKQNGITIANCSWGGGTWTDGEINNFKYLVDDWGGILVVSAGNNYTNIDTAPYYPACIDSDNIITVAAANANCTNIATATDWGWTAGSSHGSNYGVNSVDIVAPGTGIYVLKESNGEYDNGCGTSFASPFVSGTAALLKAKYPAATSSEIIMAIQQGAVSYTWTEDKVKYGFLNVNNSLIALGNILNNQRTVEDGTYILGASENAFQVIDIVNSSTLNNAASTIYESNGSDSQKYVVKYELGDLGNNYYTIQNLNSGKYLEATNGGTSPGTLVKQNQWNGTNAQKWKIVESSSGVYKIINKASGLAIDFGVSRPGNNQSITLQSSANVAKQKFRFIVSGNKVNVPDGLYTIGFKANSSLSICENNGNAELGSSDIYRVQNEDGFCYISKLFGNKALDLTNGGTSSNTNIQLITEDESSNNQKWIIKDGGDGYSYIVSYLTGNTIGAQNEGTVAGTNVVSNIPTGSDSQRFLFKELDRNNAFAFPGMTLRGYCYAMDTVQVNGIDIATNTLYNLNDIDYLNHHVCFNRELYGLYTIRDVVTGELLQVSSNGTVVFEIADGSERQLWNITYTSGVYYFENVYTGRFLKYIVNQDNSIDITTCVDPYDSDYNNIVFYNYSNIQEDIDYLIIPKNDPGKAVTLDDSSVTTNIPLVLDAIDYSNEAQKYQFCYDTYGYYKIISSEYSNLNIHTTMGSPAVLSTGRSLYTVNQTEDGYYKFCTISNRTIEYGNNTIYLNDNKIENDDSQKFMLVPVTDTITNGTYQILLNDDQTKAVSVGNSMDENSSISVETSNSTDNSQLFYVYKCGDGYRIVSLYSGNSICLTGNFNSITQKHFSSNDMSQIWQLLNTTSSNANYTTKIVSHRTGDYLWSNSNSINTAYFDNRTDQLFVLNRVVQAEYIAIGEVVSNSDTTKDLSISGTDAILSSITNNGRTTLRFTCDTNGFWSIVERTNDKVLDYSNGTLSFNTSTGSDTQKWIIRKVSTGNYAIINLETGKALTNNNGSLTLDFYSGQQAQKFNILIKGDINCDGSIASADLLMLRRFVAGIIDFTEEEVYCGDINEDGNITMVDILMLRRYLVGDIELRSGITVDSDISRRVDSSVITEEALLDMTDEEFLRFLFGDIDYSSLQLVIFD